MSTIEDRVRDALADMAGQVSTVSMLGRLDASREAARPRRPQHLRLAAAVAALAVLLGLVIAVRWDRPSIVAPVDHPPKVLHLSDQESQSPGRADLALFVAMTDDKGVRAFVWSPTAEEAVALPETPGLPYGSAWTQQLSLDGTHLVRQRWYDNRLELIDLRSGWVDDLEGLEGYCPAVSPTNSSVVFVRPSGRDAVVFDVASGRQTVVGSTAHSVVTDESDCTDDTFSWSPDGLLVTVAQGRDTFVVDTVGRVRQVIRNAHVTNSSMAWSPDGRRLLLYQQIGGFVIVTLADGGAVTLTPPSGGVRPLGWAGNRIVWLSGSMPGRQSLVIADADGDNAQLWCRLDIGEQVIRTVQWSDRLAGTGR